MLSYASRSSVYLRISKHIFKVSTFYKPSTYVYKYHGSFKAVVCSFCSVNSNTSKQSIVSNENDQINNLRGQEVEFEPSRKQDVYQNAVEEVSHSPSGQNCFKDTREKEDDKEHLAAYQCSTTVHLNAVMQTMVPDPFTTKGKAPVHLNMPGGTWSQGQKYLSNHQHGSHQTAIKENDVQIIQKRDCHSQGSSGSQTGLSQRQRLKQIIKDYGSTVLVFHVGMSLCSVGLFYLAVSSGLDVGALLTKLGFSTTNIAVGGSTFVVAYAVHKVFAPLRIAITISVTPFIVRYLRRVGILKTTHNTNSQG